MLRDNKIVDKNNFVCIWVYLKMSIYYIKLYYIKILIYYIILKMSSIFTEIFLPVLILGIYDCKGNLIILKYLHLYHI